MNEFLEKLKNVDRDLFEKDRKMEKDYEIKTYKAINLNFKVISDNASEDRKKNTKI